MKIDFLIGENSYSTVVHFSKSLAAALNRLGVTTRHFWVGEGHFFHAFYEILSDPPDLTCSFSDISLGTEPLGNLWQIPHMTLLVDPPIYFLHQFKNVNGWLACVDELDCDFVRKNGYERVFFLPHAADASLWTCVDSPRCYNTVFFGTCIDYEKVAEAWPKEKKELLHTACDAVLTNQGLSIAQVLHQLKISPEDFAYVHGEVDQYIRGKDRILLLNSIKNDSVYIWGGGPWGKYCPQHQIHPPLYFDETISIMKQSKVVLNSSPRFKKGGHERIFYALMCGAHAYTGENSFIKETFPALSTYRFGEWSVPNFVNWQEQACQGQEIVKTHHTWDNRASKLLEHIYRHK